MSCQRGTKDEYFILTAIKMLNRAMNFLKRKRSDKEENREPVSGEPSQAIVPYGSKVLHPPSSLFFLKSHGIQFQRSYLIYLT